MEDKEHEALVTARVSWYTTQISCGPHIHMCSMLHCKHPGIRVHAVVHHVRVSQGPVIVATATGRKQERAHIDEQQLALIESTER